MQNAQLAPALAPFEKGAEEGEQGQRSCAQGKEPAASAEGKTTVEARTWLSDAIGDDNLALGSCAAVHGEIGAPKEQRAAGPQVLGRSS